MKPQGEMQQRRGMQRRENRRGPVQMNNNRKNGKLLKYSLSYDGQKEVQLTVIRQNTVRVVIYLLK